MCGAYCEAGYPKLKGTARKRPTTIAKDLNRYNFRLAKQLGDEPISRLDTACARRWLDKIPTEGARSHCLALLKSLLSFSTSRGIAQAHRIDIACSPLRKVANYYTPRDLMKLDSALVDLMQRTRAGYLHSRSYGSCWRPAHGPARSCPYAGPTSISTSGGTVSRARRSAMTYRSTSPANCWTTSMRRQRNATRT